MPNYDIAVLAGDGIGEEITAEAVKVANAAVSAIGGVILEFDHLDCSASRWQRTGVAMDDAEYRRCEQADAIFMGAIGLPEACHEDGTEVAGDIIFRLRFGMNLYAGIRPVRSLTGVPSLLANGDGIDYVVVRENVEGLYASRGGGTNVRDEVATDTLVITRVGTERVVRAAFKLARTRAQGRAGRAAKVTCVDKANVLASYAFFRKVFDEVAATYPDVQSEHVYVDAMTLYQLQRPQSFDVIVAENMFGDIISDLSAGTVGGLGLAASGDVGDEHGLFQPAHGSAPDIAGKGTANPTAAILSASMMLDWLGRRHEDDNARKAAQLIEDAVASALSTPGGRTPDLGGQATTSGAGDEVVAQLLSVASGACCRDRDGLYQRQLGPSSRATATATGR